MLGNNDKRLLFRFINNFNTKTVDNVDNDDMQRKNIKL